jgi:cob(I)alamin adenosyltransferase
VGSLLCVVAEAGVKEHLTLIQKELFVLGAHLAADPEKPALKLPPIHDGMVFRLEKEIDAMEENLTPLRHFLLPGGSESVSRAHLCRAVCRRAERRVVAHAAQDRMEAIIIRYLNRLSDYFFVLSRHFSRLEGVVDVAWLPEEMG